MPKSVKASQRRKVEKETVRKQCGALCYRVVKGKTQVLLVTSRTTRRWIIPKGWLMDGLTAYEAAEIEAMEEAGVDGRIRKSKLGIYSYRKYHGDGSWWPVSVSVYALKVKDLRMRFKEADERTRKWFSPKKAARKVVEPELQKLLRRFDPKALK